jgi:hypothetical protein
MGELEGRDPAQMRISDADRHRVAEVLRDAAGEGRLDLSELEERLEATWAAKTYGDLVGTDRFSSFEGLALWLRLTFLAPSGGGSDGCSGCSSLSFDGRDGDRCREDRVRVLGD